MFVHDKNIPHFVKMNLYTYLTFYVLLHIGFTNRFSRVEREQLQPPTLGGKKLIYSNTNFTPY